MERAEPKEVESSLPTGQETKEPTKEPRALDWFAACGLCVIAVLLGCFNIALSFVEFDVTAGILVQLLSLPTIFFLLSERGPLSYGRWRKWDAILFSVPLIALAYDLAVLVIKALLAQIGLERLPDVVIFAMLSLACFSRAYFWVRVARNIAGEKSARKKAKILNSPR